MAVVAVLIAISGLVYTFVLTGVGMKLKAIRIKRGRPRR